MGHKSGEQVECECGKLNSGVPPTLQSAEGQSRSFSLRVAFTRGFGRCPCSVPAASARSHVTQAQPTRLSACASWGPGFARILGSCKQATGQRGRCLNCELNFRRKEQSRHEAQRPRNLEPWACQPGEPECTASRLSPVKCARTRGVTRLKGGNVSNALSTCWSRVSGSEESRGVSHPAPHTWSVTGGRPGRLFSPWGETHVPPVACVSME